MSSHRGPGVSASRRRGIGAGANVCGGRSRSGRIFTISTGSSTAEWPKRRSCSGRTSRAVRCVAPGPPQSVPHRPGSGDRNSGPHSAVEGTFEAHPGRVAAFFSRPQQFIACLDHPAKSLESHRSRNRKRLLVVGAHVTGRRSGPSACRAPRNDAPAPGHLGWGCLARARSTPAVSGPAPPNAPMAKSLGIVGRAPQNRSQPRATSRGRLAYGYAERGLVDAEPQLASATGAIASRAARRFRSASRRRGSLSERAAEPTLAS